MRAANADRPQDFLLEVAIDRPLPVLVDLGAVRRVIPRTLRLLVPVDVVAEHRLAMGRADDDAHPVRKLHVLRARDELVSARMHRGPDDVQSAAQHQLENLLVALRAKGLRSVRLVVVDRPRPEAPAFVVYEDAAVLDGGRIDLHGLCRKVELRARHDGDVVHPVERRDAEFVGNRIDAIDRAAPIRARNRPYALCIGAGRRLPRSARLRAHDDLARVSGMTWARARDVCAKVLCGDLDRIALARRNFDGDGEKP